MDSGTVALIVGIILLVLIIGAGVLCWIKRPKTDPNEIIDEAEEEG